MINLSKSPNTTLNPLHCTHDSIHPATINLVPSELLQLSSGKACQGYWPESLLTPPDDGAIERDLRQIKAWCNAVNSQVVS